ncbi:MAG: DUF1080 domain-containing protein [Gemmatimonadaceae bacterium]|nr:DUF1080 domain-containing protein [Chitinophagaceae bacterium]
MTALFMLCGCSHSPSRDDAFFNGKDLSGWTAGSPEQQKKYWSVEDSAIVGRATDEMPRNQFIWSSVKVKDFYLSIDVKLESADRNAGIQFRSKKMDDYGQAMGYQADIGMNYGINIWGTLYEEDARGLLHTSDPKRTVVKDGQWNKYEILASGDRIWIAVNGDVVSATRDKAGTAEGYIALQIHSGPAQTVRYRINALVHHPVVSLGGKSEAVMNSMLHKPLVPVPGQRFIDLKSGNVVAFTGGTNIANMQNDGYLETLLTAYFDKSNVKYRNLGWEGDQVTEQYRDVGFGDWLTNLDSLQNDVVFVQFGQMEALQGEKELPAFIDAYKKLLDTLRNKGKQVVILSPIAYDPAMLKVNDQPLWNNPLEKTAMQQYMNAIQLMAQTEGYAFVDLYWTLMDSRNQVTYDGIHLIQDRQKLAAEVTMKSLGIGKPYTPELEPLRDQINKKNKIWFGYWRPGNWAFLNGDRTEQAFSRHWKDGSNRIFPAEMKVFGPILEDAEKKIGLLQEDLGSGKTSSNTTTAVTKNTSAPVIVENKSGVEDPSVAEELASFRLDKNYKIELFASEALGIAEPCAMRWDEKGRLWVLCIPAYPQPVPGQSTNDKLIVLEDVDKDGKADKSTVFADSLNIPLGFELGHNGVYLGEQTRLLFLKDTSNDLKADLRKTLLSGFGTHDSHQTINSFTWSPGGDLFFSQGLSIHSYVETPWGVKSAHRGGLWRYRPSTQQLDNILDESTASDNPWGMTFGDWGEWFTKSNDTGVYFSSAAMILTSHKALVPEIGATRIKSGSVEIPRSNHLPADIREDFLIAGYYNNKVERMKISESGAGYTAKLVEPLLSSVSKNFRPVDIKTGPDGAIYVLDWYNPIIGHYQASLRDPQRDKTHGRVWKITALGRPLSKPPVLDGQSIPNLLNELKSDDYWVRYQSRRLLASKPAAAVLPAVAEWIKSLSTSGAAYEHHLMEALAVYETFETVDEPLLRKLLKAREPRARAYAAQVTGRWSDRLPAPLELIKPLLQDKHPRVRLMALVSISQVYQPEAMGLAAGIIKYPMDKFIRHAFDKTVFALKDSWEPAFRKNETRFANNNELGAVISILTPEWYTAKMYRNLLSVAEYPADVKSKLLSALCKVGEPADIEYLLSLPFTQKNAPLLEEIGKGKAPVLTENAIRSIGNTVANEGSEAILIAAFKLIKSWNIGSLSPLVSKRVLAPRQSDQVIAQGISALVAVKAQDALAILDKFSAETRSKTVRLACVFGYAKIDVARGAIETVKEMKRGSGDVNEMRETVIAMIYEPGGIAALTAEVKKQGLSPNLASAALVALDQRHVNDAALLATIQTFESTTASTIPKEYNEKYITKLVSLVKSSGNASEGEKVYRNKLTCNACHILNDKGGNIGPNLAAIGSGLSVSDIITEVLWPNKNIKEGYYSVRLDLKNGEAKQGIKVMENAAYISIKTTPSTAPVAFNKTEVLKITPVGSAMAEGLASSISEAELANVIKYLQEQRNK